MSLSTQADRGTEPAGGHRALVSQDGRNFPVRIPASVHSPAHTYTYSDANPDANTVLTRPSPREILCVSLFITVCCSLW